MPANLIKNDTKWRITALVILCIGAALTLLAYLNLKDDILTALVGLASFGVYLLVRIIPSFFTKATRRQPGDVGEPTRWLEAEGRIKALLEGLGSEYYFINAVTSPYGRIDYVVLNQRKGAFLLMVEVLQGMVSVNDGQVVANGKPAPVDYPAKMLQQAYWFKDEMVRLSGTRPWITPVVVFTHASVTANKPVNGVLLTNWSILTKVLQNEGRPVASNSAIWEIRARIESELKR